jgi:DNA-binding transcriptional LysR family regulator
MELRHLRYFTAVAEEMNFIRAAKRLNLSQPPLSRQIKMLEDELGTSLIDRTTKRITLTEAGLYFKNEATRILDEISAIERHTRLVGESQGGCVRLGYVGSMMITLLPELLAHLKEGLCDIKVDIVELATEEQGDALLSGKIDVGLLRSWVVADGLRFDSLGEESLSIVHHSRLIPPPGAEPLQFFSGQSFVSSSRSAAPGLTDRIQEICLGAGFAPKVEYECGQFSSVLNLVAAGLGWSIVPTLALRKTRIENINLIPLPGKILFGLAYKAAGVPARVKSVIEVTRGFIGKFLTTQA